MLKDLARQARDRLKGGFWQAKPTKQAVMELQNPEYQCEFYRRVSELLVNGVVSPLSLLIDHDYIATLGENEKERYVFDLGTRVQKCIIQYENLTFSCLEA